LYVGRILQLAGIELSRLEVNRTVVYDILRKEAEGDLSDRSNLRSHGITSEIVFTVDHGEEFGGKSWMKVQELKKLISAFGCRLIQNRKGHPEDNPHLERSHRTDDEEFYIQRVFKIMTPFDYLKGQLPGLDDTIKLVPPVILDNVSTKIGPWGGYNVLTQNRIDRAYISNLEAGKQNPTLETITKIAEALEVSNQLLK